jgi:hypothetical protein
MDVRFGTWNERSLYRAGYLMIVAKEISKYKLVGVQEVRWDRGGTKPAGEYAFSMERGMRIISNVQVFFVRKRIISAFKRVVC